MQKSKDRYHKKVEQSHNMNVMSSGVAIPAGVYFGIVVTNTDPNELQRVLVHISSLFSAIMPFNSGGTTPVSSNTPQPDDYADTFLGALWCQRLMPYGGTTGNSSFGLLGPAPNQGDEVLVAFSGDSDRGVILGIIPDVKRYQNTTGPTSKVTDEGKFLPANEPSPASETPDAAPDAHPLASSIQEQGLEQDAIRGQNFSSHIRDQSTRVFGISTPSGHSFVMDDGSTEDDNFNLVRLRTGGGSQILMDDNNGFIYIINRNGSGWIEINRNGDFDIFSGGNVNIHTTGEFNVHANGNINMQGDKGVNLKAGEGVKIQAAGGNIDLHAQGNANITADGNGNLSIAGNLRMSAGRIDLNGAAAEVAAKPTIAQLGENSGITQSISGRVPEREPWNGHLDQPRISTSGPSAGEMEPAPSGSSAAGYNNDFAISDTSLGNGTINWAVDAAYKRKVNSALLNKLETIIKEYGRPINITSGYRTPSSNKGASASRHLVGDAVDFQHRDGTPFSKSQVDRLVQLASQNGIMGIGVYPTPRGNVTSSNSAYLIHFDLGRNEKVSWGHTYKKASTPVFARPILSRYGYY